MNNREKIIGGYSFWRPTEAAKTPIFERFTFPTVIYNRGKVW